MLGADQDETISIGTIPHKVSEEDEASTAKANWYVCGDKEGEYNLSATVTGNNPDPFVKTFTTDKPVKVYAGSALLLTIRPEDIAYSEEEYHVQLNGRTFPTRNCTICPLASPVPSSSVWSNSEAPRARQP